MEMSLLTTLSRTAHRETAAKGEKLASVISHNYFGFFAMCSDNDLYNIM